MPYEQNSSWGRSSAYGEQPPSASSIRTPQSRAPCSGPRRRRRSAQRPRSTFSRRRTATAATFPCRSYLSPCPSRRPIRMRRTRSGRRRRSRTLIASGSTATSCSMQTCSSVNVCANATLRARCLSPSSLVGVSRRCLSSSSVVVVCRRRLTPSSLAVVSRRRSRRRLASSSRRRLVSTRLDST